MSEEIEYTVEGELLGSNVLVSDERAIEDLSKRGYGERDGRKYVLQIYEALYLIHSNKMTIRRKGQDIDFDKLVDIALKKDGQAWTRFLIYRDLRSRGYVAKEGFGFGVDFRVYERGEFGNKPAKYVVFGLNEGTTWDVAKLSESIEQMMRMGKEPVIAVIERRGEVIYYKMSRMRFISSRSAFDVSAIAKE